MTDSPQKRDLGEILIVEDSPTQALELQNILEEHGFGIRCAKNGREALEMLTDWVPDLIVSDIVMPEMGGYELCSAVKQIPRHKELPVILLTSLSDPIDVIRGLESGADNFVVKPIDKDYLISRISLLLLNRRLIPTPSKMGVEVVFGGQTFFITSDRLQILNLLLSTYETAVRQNRQLTEARGELEKLNEELEHKAAELQTANGELESFSYSISHDLRAPLRTITSFVEAVLEDFELSADLKDYLHRILGKSLKMRSMIDALLMLSRFTSKPLRKGRVDMGMVVREIILELETDRADRVVEWEIGPLMQCYGDPDLIRQVFSNLLSNSFKYTVNSKTSQIAIGGTIENGKSVYFVKDNGVGFSQSSASRVFDVFHRLHGDDEFEGSGIGLSIVKRIVERHGGKVWAESEEGRGATFFVSLPQAG